MARECFNEATFDSEFYVETSLYQIKICCPLKLRNLPSYWRSFSNEQLCSCQVFFSEVMSLRDRHRNEELNEMTWKKHTSFLEEQKFYTSKPCKSWWWWVKWWMCVLRSRDSNERIRRKILKSFFWGWVFCLLETLKIQLEEVSRETNLWWVNTGIWMWLYLEGDLITFRNTRGLWKIFDKHSKYL